MKYKNNKFFLAFSLVALLTVGIFAFAAISNTDFLNDDNDAQVKYMHAHTVLMFQILPPLPETPIMFSSGKSTNRLEQLTNILFKRKTEKAVIKKWRIRIQIIP